MEHITLGQIALIIAFLVALIKGLEYLQGVISRMATRWVRNCLKPINERLDAIDLGTCKNYLVRFLKDVEQGNKVDEVEIERFYEVYQHYTTLGGNSYIHDKVEKLKKENKL